MKPRLNEFRVIGRLGADPEISYLQNGTPVCKVRIALDEGYYDTRTQPNQWKDQVIWLKAQQMGKGADSYVGFKKGDLVYALGRYWNRSWQDQQQQTRYDHFMKMVFMAKLIEAKDVAPNPYGQQATQGHPQTPTPPPPQQGYPPQQTTTPPQAQPPLHQQYATDPDDDIPF